MQWLRRKRTVRLPIPLPPPYVPDTETKQPERRTNPHQSPSRFCIHIQRVPCNWSLIIALAAFLESLGHASDLVRKPPFQLKHTHLLSPLAHALILSIGLYHHPSFELAVERLPNPAVSGILRRTRPSPHLTCARDANSGTPRAVYLSGLVPYTLRSSSALDEDGFDTCSAVARPTVSHSNEASTAGRRAVECLQKPPSAVILLLRARWRKIEADWCTESHISAAQTQVSNTICRLTFDADRPITHHHSPTIFHVVLLSWVILPAGQRCSAATKISDKDRVGLDEEAKIASGDGASYTLHSAAIHGGEGSVYIHRGMSGERNRVILRSFYNSS
ncbi:hypothetical protein B0H16DRAFT_1899063 [Mycena metata]|uniref:Uncharacterized protein n=1 Tax=Mycena metata TaxID=1033252 RepID=A0AAD7H8I9_9AGAR|nr:hypothetical protein B0H16DRAFT_1899063 [Mycena metata]